MRLDTGIATTVRSRTAPCPGSSPCPSASIVPSLIVTHSFSVSKWQWPWNRRVCTRLGLASFAQHNIFEILRFYHFLAEWPWAICLTALSSVSLIFIVGVTVREYLMRTWGIEHRLITASAIWRVTNCPSLPRSE